MKDLDTEACTNGEDRDDERRYEHVYDGLYSGGDVSGLKVDRKVDCRRLSSNKYVKPVLDVSYIMLRPWT